MTEEEKIDPLRVILDHVLVVERDIDLMERTLGDIFALLGGILPLFRSAGFQEPGAIGLAADLGSFLGPYGIAVGVVPVMVRVQYILDRLVGRLLDGRDNVARLLGKVRVHDDHIILENNPRMVAAAEGYGWVGCADRRIAEEDARRDLFDVVKLQFGDRYF